MLMRFGIANHLSIREYQEVSLVASSLKGGTTELIETPALKEKLVPLVLVYGANASGKSNLLAGLERMIAHIVNSFRSNAPKGDLPANPFLLDVAAAKEPTRFDVDFLIDGVRYHYGFTFDRRRFIDEWLYAFPSGTRQVWYTRTDTDQFYFGKNLRGRNKAIEGFTRRNSLFLSAAAQNAHQQLTPIFDYFNDDIIFDLSATVSPSEVELHYEPVDKRIVDFLRHADVGISDITIDDYTLESDRSENGRLIWDDLREIFKKHYPSAPDPFSVSPKYKIRFNHFGRSSSSVPIEIDHESRGTLRLFQLMTSIVAALDNPKVIVVDELDASLHTLLAMKIIEIFGTRAFNRNGSQLIATTHDTNLLCLDSLRRDQIWFAEKTREGETSVYPLTDIRTRQEDNLEKGYLQGRFGGVPFLGSVNRLFGLEDREIDGVSNE